jgi:hypothetical protein
VNRTNNHSLPRIAAYLFALVGVVLSAWTAASAQEEIQPRKTVGRFIALGTTEVSSAWKAAHPSDVSFIYLLDSATGRIEICSDAEGICRVIPASERDPKGSLIGRFTAVKVTPANAVWNSRHPLDDHLVYSLDSTNAQVQACGDMEGACAVISGPAHAAAAWPKIVMLYRRADSAAIAGRIYDRLVGRYGADAVFLDIYKIPLATDWRERVREITIHGGALVALIGPRWLGKRPDGSTRIHDPDDPVRNELETALAANVPVFPILLEGASMPSTSDLPASLKQFPNINAATVDVGRDFDQHMARLIEAIDQHLATQKTPLLSK